ncbi:MAG: hypothetical protein KIT27_06240 [Legionellales bacterium]|nr:hypothetical protein [Legionellales bacterium]
MTRILDIKWRQGEILSLANLQKLNVMSSDTFSSKKTIAVVISHSCDIASAEPNVEFLYGDIIDQSEGNYLNAKHLRKLHLPILNEKHVTIQLVADRRFSVSKNDLRDISPDPLYVFDDEQRKVLQNWLGARYKRQELPDALQARLVPLWNYIEKHGKNNTPAILGYWVNFDPSSEELSENDPYDFEIYIVYSARDPAYEVEAKKLAIEIKQNFVSLIKKTKHLGPVNLLTSQAYSEHEFTLHDMTQNMYYRFDYLSFRNHPHDHVLEAT